MRKSELVTRMSIRINKCYNSDLRHGFEYKTVELLKNILIVPIFDQNLVKFI